MNESENNLDSVQYALARQVKQRLVSLRILHSPPVFITASAHYESNWGFYLVWVSTLSMMPYSLVCPPLPLLATHQYWPLCSGSTGEITNPTCSNIVLLHVSIFLIFRSVRSSRRGSVGLLCQWWFELFKLSSSSHFKEYIQKVFKKRSKRMF